jgi:phosphoglycolate phosphatase-like HAD superfamily hydrolase
MRGQGRVDIGKVDENVEEFYDRIRQHDPALFPDVLPALQQLWNAGYTLVVCSGNAPDIVESRLAHTGIKQYFSFWLGTDPAVGLSKGEAHFRILRERLSMSQADFQCNSMSVGDAAHDVQVAKAAGIISVGRVNSLNASSLQEAQPDYLIADFSELLQILLFFSQKNHP